MGGSLIIDGIEAKPYDTRQGLSEIYSILEFVKPHCTGWRSDIAVENYLAGSSRVAVDNRAVMCDNAITLGDIDVFIDRKEYDKFARSMSNHAGEILYFRQGKIRATSLIKVDRNIRQIDFIPCDFENGMPKPFFVFSHSSHIDDIIKGIKGYAHKILCRSFTAETSYHFSVDYGIRVDGSYEYDTDIHSVVNKIFRCDVSKVMSFTMLLNELHGYSDSDRNRILSKFALLAFGADRQKTSRFPHQDMMNMTRVYQEIERQDLLTPTMINLYSERKQHNERKLCRGKLQDQCV